MFSIRRAQERGQTLTGWLNSRHSFSFGEYYDADHLGFGDLVVINDDWIAPGQGFGQHGHRDMEIVTYVLEGELRHQDSLGTGSTLRHGDVQRMSAGKGILHSEFNASPSTPLHLLQIWIQTARQGIAPSYEEKTFSFEKNTLTLIASPEARDGSLRIFQDVDVYAGIFDDGGASIYQSGHPSGHTWIQVARGSVQVNDDVVLEEGDGLATTEEVMLSMKARGPAELLVFEMR